MHSPESGRESRSAATSAGASNSSLPEHFDHLESTNVAFEKCVGPTPFPDLSTKIEI